MIEEMASLLTTIQSKEEFALLLDGILTPAEVESIHLRWELLKLLKSGVTQRDIQSRLGICLGKNLPWLPHAQIRQRGLYGTRR